MGAQKMTTQKRVMKFVSPLLLSPSIALSHPRAWQSLPSLPIRDQHRISEVHCIGGGSLLLWLLIRAKRIPRIGQVVIHGPLVLPTADSCAQWAEAIECPAYVSTEREWRTEALCLGLDGALSMDDRKWLLPILHDIAAGKSNELCHDMLRYRDRWYASGRLHYEPLTHDDTEWSCSPDKQWCLLED